MCTHLTVPRDVLSSRARAFVRRDEHEAAAALLDTDLANSLVAQGRCRRVGVHLEREKDGRDKSEGPPAHQHALQSVSSMQPGKVRSPSLGQIPWSKLEST